MVMSSRLERAIKELAAARAEPRASTDPPRDSGKSGEKPGGQTKEKSVVTPSGPTGSVIAYHQDVRHYVVVEHPKGLVGYLVGPGATTWRALESTLPGRRLQGSGARLRRVDNRQEAKKIWEASHGSRQMPDLHL